LLDFMLRSGPYGDHYGVNPDGLTLEKLKENPHGVDLGYLQPRIPEVLRTASGKIELAPAPIVADVPRLQADLAEASLFPNGHLLLIGRRDLRSNNSWMHNLPVLAKGEKRCTLLMNPADAERLQLADGAAANVTGRVGQLTATVELTPNIMPGVVSLPHGWGHGLPGVRLSVASETDGVNSNVLTDEAACDPVSGNAVLNGIPVTVEKDSSKRP
jgi:anaerobic selenocysteine-containing dehydrogenase